MKPAVFVLVLFLLLGLAERAQAQLNDSGQTACYGGSDSTAASGEVGSGTPLPEPTGFEAQDCTLGAAAADALGLQHKRGAGSAGFDFSKVSQRGNLLPAGAARGDGPDDWGCVLDHRSGLIWELKASSGLRAADHRYSWRDDDAGRNGGDPGSLGTDTCAGTLPAGQCNTQSLLAAVNALSGDSRLCGATDWRLPSEHELQSIVDYGAASGAAVDVEYFPDAAPVNYWTASNYAAESNGDSAWVVNFVEGDLLAETKTGALRVRLVRSAP